MGKSTSTTNVQIFVPGRDVPSMTDEVTDGSVNRAVQAARAAYSMYDSDGQIPTVTYSGDLAGAVTRALTAAGETDGHDLLVIVTDGVTSDPTAVQKQLDGLEDDFVLFLTVDNQPDPAVTARLTKFDDEGPKADSVDTLAISELPGTEVEAWLTKVAA